MRRLAVLGLAAAIAAAGPGTAAAQDCEPGSYRVVADVAPLAGELVQGLAVPLPIGYAHVEHETEPRYVYAEAGSTTLGPLEGMVLQPRQLTGLLAGTLPLPVDLPPLPDLDGAPAVPVPPGRAASSYPESSLPPAATGDWGAGTSRTEAGADRAVAASTIVEGLGGGSSITSTVECDRVVVEVGWTLGPLAQSVRIELGPTGEPTVEVANDLPDLGLGDLLAAVFAPSGQEVAAGPPVVEVTDGAARVVSAPVRVRFAPPAGSQAVGLQLGQLSVEVERLPPAPPLPDPPPPPPVDGDAPAAGVAPGRTAGGSVPSSGSTVLAGPAGGPVAARPTPLVVDLVRTVSRPATWWPVLAVVAALLAWWRLAVANRHRWPTADWTLRRLSALARRFAAAYLRW